MKIKLNWLYSYNNVTIQQIKVMTIIKLNYMKMPFCRLKMVKYQLCVTLKDTFPEKQVTE